MLTNVVLTYVSIASED